MTLQNIIQELIALKKEGEYWDFKLKHHDDPADLIKDIICLANTVRYKGDRYLIIGVEPTKYTIEDVSLKPENKRTQACIIDTLRGANFSSGSFPDIRLETIEISGCSLDVIIIADRPDKPYYLEDDKLYKPRQPPQKTKGIAVRAGVVYSRVADANTPSNKVAPSLDIEKMWKERFGLTQTQLERVKMYLSREKEWEQIGEIIHHKFFPEFTLEPSQSDDKLDYQQEWTRGEIGASYQSQNNAFMYHIKYHQTILAKIHVVIFDGGKKSIVAPDWRPFGAGRIYFYLRDSINFSFQNYWASCHLQDDSINLRKTNGQGRFSIPIFQNCEELEAFLSRYCPPADCEPIKDNDKKQQNQIFYQALDCYKDYKMQASSESVLS